MEHRQSIILKVSLVKREGVVINELNGSSKSLAYGDAVVGKVWVETERPE